jgi:hypothetical protein
MTANANAGEIQRVGWRNSPCLDGRKARPDDGGKDQDTKAQKVLQRGIKDVSTYLCRLQRTRSPDFGICAPL